MHYKDGKTGFKLLIKEEKHIPNNKIGTSHFNFANPILRTFYKFLFSRKFRTRFFENVKRFKTYVHVHLCNGEQQIENNFAMNPMNKGNQFGVGGNRQAVKRVGRGNKIAPAKYLGDHSSSRIDGLNQQNDRDIENGK